MPKSSPRTSASVFRIRGLGEHTEQTTKTHEHFSDRLAASFRRAALRAVRSLPMGEMATRWVDTASFDRDEFEREVARTMAGSFDAETRDLLGRTARSGVAHQLSWAKQLGLDPAQVVEAERVYRDKLTPWANSYTQLLLQGQSESWTKGTQRVVIEHLARAKMGDTLTQMVIDTLGLPPQFAQAYVNYQRSLKAQGSSNLFVREASQRYARRMRDSQSRTFARTAVSTALNYGRLAYLSELGIDGLAKRWVTLSDELVCPTCGPLDSLVVDLDSVFPTGVGALPAPPAHPNCRCIVVPDGGELTQRRNDLPLAG